MTTRPGNGVRRFVLVTVLLAAASAPHADRAALGEPEAAIDGEAQRQHASIKSTERANYRIHDVALPSGTVLREFSTAGGNVFAVAWSGPVIPDLREALGRYYDAFAAAAAAKRGGRHRLAIRQDDLVLRSNGHMRAYTGLAYLPQALPAGVSADELH